MKKIIKIACALCLFLALPSNSNAQWRFGIEGGPGFAPNYHYDNNGFYKDKEMAGRVQGQANFMVDYMLPRRWTPNYLVLSLRTGIGVLYAEDNSGGGSTTGIDLPLEAEIKYLVSNKFRVYLNGGVTIFGAIEEDDYDGYYRYDDYGENRQGNFGYQFGAGIEIGNFRIGYKNLSFTKTIRDWGDEEYGNKLKSAHMVSVGFWFNGNRFLKRNSKLKSY